VGGRGGRLKTSCLFFDWGSKSQNWNLFLPVGPLAVWQDGFEAMAVALGAPAILMEQKEWLSKKYRGS
jgi:hypothetical protein